MKAKLLIFSLCIASLQTIGQSKIGITTGVLFSHTRTSSSNTDARFAYNVGVASLFELSAHIQLNMQLLFIGKGYKYYNTFGQRNLVKPMYLEIPIVPRFHFRTTENAEVFIGIGGYYALGIGGKETYYQNDERLQTKIEYGQGTNSVLTQSDGGVVMQVGTTFRDNFEGYIFYDMGLANIIPNTTTRTYNRVIGFNLAWYFPLGADKK